MNRNPLNKRFLRDLRDDLGKYVVIALLMIFTIGLISGFLVADGSMVKAYNESFTKYNVEDGNFRTQKRMNKAQLKSAEGLGLYLYELFYREFSLENGSTIRVIAQNLPNYLLLLFGIFFANILLIFGLALPKALDHYQQIIRDNLLAPHQYILQIPLEAMDEDHKLSSALRMFEFMAAVETDNETAEKFSAYTLRTPPDGPYKCEDVMVYGMDTESSFVQGIPKSEKGQDPRILISSAYSDKYDIFAGDTIELQEKYGADKYRFTVAGAYDYPASICVFMEQSALNQCFDLGKDYFSGYMSQTPITDIDEKYIGTEIDFESLTKVTRQLTISMGSMMYLVDFFAVAIFLVLIYILSKIIIEKNAQSISMAKILGYTGGEIARLYIRATTVVYLVCFAATIPLVTVLIRYLMKMMIRMEMTGWIDLYVGWPVYVEMIILGVLSYAVVALFEYRKIGRVPMDEALKNAE